MPRPFRTYFMRGGIPDSIPDAVASDGIDCDDSVFSRSEWRFQPAAVSTLFDRIMAVGRPLGEVVDARWQTALAGWQQSHAGLTARLVSIKGEINDRVYALFGLTPADVALLEDHAKHAMIDYPLGEA